MTDNEKPEARKSPESKPTEKKPEPMDRLVETKHSVITGGQEIKYTVITGTIVLKEETIEQQKDDEGEKPKASIFFIAYLRDGATDKSKRPITFSFNGGPGSSSVWLHMGLLGPRRVAMEFDGSLPPPPFRLIDNEYSLLNETDLVFIDPVSTGFSRPIEGEKAGQFHSFKKDIESVGNFIRLFVTRYQRWLSPKFLIGESYGTTRAGGLSGYLQERHGLFINGIMLVSSVLDFSTLLFYPGNDLPYVLFLPSYAATAWYHRRLRIRRPLQRLVAEVRQFALSDYSLALAKGATLNHGERLRIAQRLAGYTGLSTEYIEQSNLRIKISRFTKELLRHEGRTIGRLDARFKGIDRDSAGEETEYDPSYSTIQGPFTACLNDYVRSELNFESDLPYEILTERVQPWSFAEHENQYVNVAETLRKAMSMNPYLKVFIANGYYDLATPFLATEYTFNHIGLDESLRGNITIGYYEAGHMMYIHTPALVELKSDLAEFIHNAMPPA